MERRLDINEDGTVTLDEIEKQKAKEFAALDKNEDGNLTPADVYCRRGQTIMLETLSTPCRTHQP